MSRFTGRQYKGAMRDLKRIRREQAEERQAAYERLLANGPVEVRIYRDRSVRPRLGRQLREAVAS